LREIYEGDLLEGIFKNWLAKVVFEDGCFMLYPFNSYQNFPKSMKEVLSLVENNSTVVGNIYENKDSLKDSFENSDLNLLKSISENAQEEII
jgi:YopX protein.